MEFECIVTFKLYKPQLKKLYKYPFLHNLQDKKKSHILIIYFYVLEKLENFIYYFKFCAKILKTLFEYILVLI